MRYLTNTFSPLMLSSEAKFAEVTEIELCDVPAVADMTSAISHEVTAAVLSAILEEPVPFARVNISLKPGDSVYCLCPSFRAEVAREFTREEVESAPLRVFLVRVL